ncbi:hypothetical protein PILCRDRAFT_10760 [Piloderma croceum F 1598]|uniref:Uncharacterized protein n=1 Tax=Piloderma croceum (strain F 1598) TaxID=765440 RepID=A0A0C3FFS5_PILCF|nr:hypothetical protein PILCRDRAFT_10760 [Piloderma croceum F 1598]
MDIKARGYVSHERSCRSKRTKQREDAVFHKSQHSVTEGEPIAGSSRFPPDPGLLCAAADDEAITFEAPHIISDAGIDNLRRSSSLELYANGTAGPQIDDIKTEFHPHSGRETIIVSFAEYGRAEKSRLLPPRDNEPWRPFRERIDFEFAEFAVQSGLTGREVDAALALHRRSGIGGSKITISSQKEMYDLIDEASVVLTSEPWQANRWYDIESRLPRNGVPFCFVLYCDKSKLSSFGTEQAHPVIMCCANLPHDIRNGQDIGGGQVVGWLPIVEETAKEKKKKKFIDFKRMVWHKSFLRILKSIRHLSRTGYCYKCFDKVVHLLFPLIFILSTDYEEQCFMALIRGANSKCPCPICLVPKDEQHDLGKTFRERTAFDTQIIVEHAMNLPRERAKSHFKKNGLRPIRNAFWSVNNSDPHRTLSFDTLHFDDSGVNSIYCSITVNHRLTGPGKMVKLCLLFVGKSTNKSAIDIPNSPNCYY